MRPVRFAGALAAALVSVSGCIAQPPVPITRADLAASYVELEQVYFAQTALPNERIADANRRFDQATLAFFAADGSGAIQQIEELTAGLRELPPTAAGRAGAALKATIEPPVFVVGSGVTATARLTGMYPLPPDAEAAELKVRLVDIGGMARGDLLPVTIATGATGFVDRTVVLAGAAALPAGAARVELVDASGAVVAGWKWDVVSEALETRRTRNEAALAAMTADDEATAGALEVCRARNGLLSDRPSASNSAQYLVDLEGLANEIVAEAAEIAAGRNPYARRVGRYWRTIATEGVAIPAWVFAPQAAKGDAALPLVIALHGAGGDEGMFVFAYGAGRLTELAEQRGFVVVSPATSTFAASVGNFDSVVGAIARDYLIDRERVYVIGHSMGTAATAGLAIARADQIAAVCCFAGSLRATGVARLAPLLGILGEIDPLSAPPRSEPPLRAAQAAGLPVEYRVAPNYGHTLLVGAELPAAMDWLLARTRGGGVLPTAKGAAGGVTP